MRDAAARGSGAGPGRFRLGPLAFLALTVALAPPGARAAGKSQAPTAVVVTTAVDRVWPSPNRLPPLGSIGERVAVVFSPDFSVPTNRLFYERLGFLYLEDASWERVLASVEAFNAANPSRAVETLIVASHGAHGNGLKLQANERPDAARSYVSIGALQERLARAGVRRCVLAACNAGRLFRPEIYNALDRNARDPLFLPATLGFLDASPGFDPKRSSVVIIRRADNLKENTTEGTAADLSPAARRALGLGDGRAVRFVVTDLFVQMLAGDPSLRLTSGGYVTDMMLENPSNARSERLYRRFVRLVDALAGRKSDSDLTLPGASG